MIQYNVLKIKYLLLIKYVIYVNSFVIYTPNVIILITYFISLDENNYF